MGRFLAARAAVDATSRFLDDGRRGVCEAGVARAELHELLIERNADQRGGRLANRCRDRRFFLQHAQVIHVAAAVARALVEIRDAEEHRVPRHTCRAPRLRHPGTLLLAHERHYRTLELPARRVQPRRGRESF